MLTLYAVLTVITVALLENFYILKTTHHLSALIVLICSLLLSLVLNWTLINKNKDFWKDREEHTNEETVLAYLQIISFVVAILSLINLYKLI